MSFFSQDNVDWVIKLSLIQSVIGVLFLLSVVSYAVPYIDVLRPYFIVISIYYWSIYRPSLLSPAYIFVIGILYDLLLGYHLGLHASIFLIIQFIIRDQRLFFLGQPYLMVWLGFIFTCFCSMAAEWLFYVLATDMSFHVMTLVWGLVLSALIFPLITLLFNVIYRILPRVQQQHLL